MWSQGQLGLTGLKAARIRSGDRWTYEKMKHMRRLDGGFEAWLGAWTCGGSGRGCAIAYDKKR